MEEEARPQGVAVQIHAYVSSSPAKSDNSALCVKDGKQIEISDGATGESLSLRLDHVFQQATEGDVMERSLRSLTTACVEGVNTSVLAVGSAKANKSRVLFSPMPEHSLAGSIFQTLLDTLTAKIASLNNSGAAVAPGGAVSGSVGSVRKTQAIASASFSLCVSFAEFYEETITDLLSVAHGGDRDDSRPGLLIQDDPELGKTVANLTQSAPLTSLAAFWRLLEAGVSARRSADGIFGHTSEFSSAVLRISVRQIFSFHDAPTQELRSLFDLVDLPATDRLTRPAGSVRLSEGPLLNKSLLALQAVIESLSGGPNSTGTSSPGFVARYDASQLTTLLQDALGGNCLTFVLLCLSPGDLAGSKATLQLGRLLPHVHTFPVVNSDMLRGLRRRQRAIQQQTQTHSTSQPSSTRPLQQTELADYERRLHDLEGKLAQNGLERRVLREDKDALTAQLNELRSKYRELFDNELALRGELLGCEQEKLALSKAFVAFQLERDTQAQTLESDKFEAETRLLRAEQLVVEIQQDDATKAAQIQDLCAKMNELVADKTRLGGELALLQQAAQAAEQARDAAAKKNQQLSLELIVAVNQKHKLQTEMEKLAAQERQRREHTEAQQLECQELRAENTELRTQAATFDASLEAMRKDVVRRELELERAEMAVRKEQLETQQAGRDADHERERSAERLRDELEVQRASFAADKRALELQLERLQADLTRESEDKHRALAARDAKNQENEELVLAVERARHDAQAELEAFRLKLALVQQSADSDDGSHCSSAAARAIKELLGSYQQREKALRDELESVRSASLRLSRRLRNPEQQRLGPSQGEDEDDVECSDADKRAHAVGSRQEEISRLRAKLEVAEQQVAAEMQQRADQALLLGELEAKLTRLEQERRTQLDGPTGNQQDSGARAITEMHAALTRQLDEVRRLTLQQQQQQQQVAIRSVDTAAPTAPTAPTAPMQAAAGDTDMEELQMLRKAKTQLEARLASTKTHWTALLEQVERRCAELLTKNVMLAEDNNNLRQHLRAGHKARHKTHRG